MARFLPSLEFKAAPKAGGDARRSLANWSFGWNWPYVQRWNVERVVRDAWERSIWVYRCVDRIATDFASLPVVMREGDPETGEILESLSRDDAQLLHLLNKRPNPYQSARAFRYLIGVQFLLSRAGVFIEVQRTKGGRVAALYVLPPDKTAPIPDEHKFVSGFRLQHAVGDYEDLPPENVIWLRKPHPTDPYSGTIPTEAAGINIDTEFYMTLFSRNFALNDGRPSAVVGVKGHMDPRDADELKSRFQGGPDRAGEVSVIEADDINYVDLATTPREAQFVEGRAAGKQDLLLAFGVPESVLGNASGRTYDNADAEEAVYWRMTVKSHANFIFDGLDRLTSGGAEDDKYLTPNYAGIYALQRDERERAVRLQTEFDKGLITADEYRDETGREPIGAASSRVTWMTAQGKIPLTADAADEKAAVELLKSANPQPEQPEGGSAEMLKPPAQGDASRRLTAVKGLDPFDADGFYRGPPIEVKVIRTEREAPTPTEVDAADLALVRGEVKAADPGEVERARRRITYALAAKAGLEGDALDEVVER